MTYNSLGQLERVTTLNNSAYKRFWYGPNYVASYTSVNNVADELYAIQVVDGLGRVIGATSNHPGSSGGYSLVSRIYDQMGRAIKVSNPTEIDSYWLVSGDDAAGIYYTQQTYDWKGRPLVTTNPDLTTKTAAYSGCGCAGGEVATLTDEGTLDGGVAKRRQQKIYSDVFGRTVKTEILNWQVAASTRPRLIPTTFVINYPSEAVCRRGRQRHLPGHDHYLRRLRSSKNEACAGTSRWCKHRLGLQCRQYCSKTYDGRGATATYSYNGRHLVTSITYGVLEGDASGEELGHLSRPRVGCGNLSAAKQRDAGSTPSAQNE